MIKESGKIVKRGSARVLGSMVTLARSGILILGTSLRGIPEIVMNLRGRSIAAKPALDARFVGTPLEKVGPIPEELRSDPFPGGSVPWSIQEAEKEQSRTRMIMILEVTIAVSWAVTIIAVLRIVGLM